MNGERNGQAKLSDSLVEVMRAIPYRRGLFAYLSRLYGVSHTTIRKAYQGETWRHVG